MNIIKNSFALLQRTASGRSNFSSSRRSKSNQSKTSSGSGSEFIYKDGRRYHGMFDAPYPLPNDITEMDG
jgi:hypothetical protein